MENILNHLPEYHARILKNVLEKIHEEKGKELQLRMSCYFRGYANCLFTSKLITYEELSCLNHQSVYEKKEE